MNVLIQAKGGLQAELMTLNLSAAMAGLSAHTRRAYWRWLRRYAAETIGVTFAEPSAVPIAHAMQAVNIGNLKGFLGKLKAEGLGRQSLMQAKAAVVWLGALMSDLGYMPHGESAALSRVKVPRAESGQRNGAWLSAQEIRLMLQRLETADELRMTVKARNLAMITLMVICGLRRDEIAAARWSDVARHGGYAVLNVHGKGEKTRLVKLPSMVIQALAEWRRYHPDPRGNAPIFPRILCNGWITLQPISDRTVWCAVKQATRIAGLPHISPHDLRRSFARGAYEAGVPYELIRQALGHSSIATTERYVNSALELRRAAPDVWAAHVRNSR